MSVHANTITKQDTVEAILQDYVDQFTGDYLKLQETVGLFGVETVNAGTAIYKYNVAGSLNNDAPDVSAPEKGSSGTGYVEGDFIKRSKYVVTKTPVGEAEFVPYAVQVTAQGILKGGFDNSIMRAVNKAHKQLRGDVLSGMFGFFNAFDTATVAAPESGTWNLQQVLAHTDEALLNSLETNNESETDLVHFINRSDAYGCLAGANISTQDLFGLTYLENFLGIQKVFLTNKVTAGSVIATPVANIRVYGIDYGGLAGSGLEYTSDDLGITGYAFDKDYDYASVNAYLVRSMTIVPEVADFVAKGYAAPVESTTTTTTTTTTTGD